MAATLEDKVALVTGGSSWIGRATASAFAQAGAKVVIANAASYITGHAMAIDDGLLAR